VTVPSLLKLNPICISAQPLINKQNRTAMHAITIARIRFSTLVAPLLTQ
jgi:hypothetical protein